MNGFARSLAEEKQTAYQHNGKARADGVDGRFTGEELAALRQRQQGYCAYCGQKQADLTVDHIVPTTRGGPNIISNICLACSKCNISKGAKTLIEWVDRWYLPWHNFLQIKRSTIRKTISVPITWSDEHQRLAELVVKRHAARMGELGIPTGSATRPGGEQGANRSGAILFALMLAAGEAGEKGE